MNKKTEELGVLPISNLLIKQSIPAAIGILVMSINMIVDTIFVGKFVDSMAIGAITVVMPITFLIAAFGMSIGVGGASMISRALGAGNIEKAHHIFGNQIILTVLLSIIVVVTGMFFEEEVLILFGAKGKVLEFSKIYFKINLWGIPALATAMMLNNVIRAEGFPKISMIVLLIPAISNMVMNPIFILGFDMGMAGAAFSTILAYFFCLAYCIRFFLGKKGQLKPQKKDLILKGDIVKEIAALGAVTMARQGSFSLVAIILNKSLVFYGDEIYLSVYGIIARVMMFALFPVLGITQGLLPIVGFNYGAGKLDRVKETLKKSILYGTLIAGTIFISILLFRETLTRLFTIQQDLLALTPEAMIIVFMATIVVPSQSVGAAYYQGIGKALPALVLTLLRQVLFFIPLMFILPPIYGVKGIWYAFPLADVLSSIVTVIILLKSTKLHKTTLA